MNIENKRMAWAPKFLWRRRMNYAEAVYNGNETEKGNPLAIRNVLFLVCLKAYR